MLVHPMKFISLMMLAALGVFLIIALICGKPTNQIILEKLEEIETPTKGVIDSCGKFFTEEYDGHKYVIYKYWHGKTSVSITHSPNCPCFRQHKGKQSGN